MKVRRGFVSNSSSCSFIVKFAKEVDPKLFKFKDDSYGEYGTTLYPANSILEWLMDSLDWADDEEKEKITEQIVEIRKNEKCIVQISADQSSSGTIEFFLDILKDHGIVLEYNQEY